MKPLLVLTAFFTVTLNLSPQGVPQDLQQKLAAVKQSVARNQAALRNYTWTAHTEISVNGQVKKTKDDMCRYGPDGQVQRTPMGLPAPQQPEPRGIRGRVMEKKKADMEDYMQRAVALIHSYIPPSPANMEQVFRAGNMVIGQAGPGTVQLLFRNYQKPGDSLAMTFDSAARAIRTMTVNSWLENPQDVVSLAITFQTLPDGTNYAATTVLNGNARHLQVTTQNSNYQKIAD